MYTSLDEVELAVGVNLETLREVLKSLSVDGMHCLWGGTHDTKPRKLLGTNHHPYAAQSVVAARQTPQASAEKHLGQ